MDLYNLILVTISVSNGLFYQYSYVECLLAEQPNRQKSQQAKQLKGLGGANRLVEDPP